VSTYYYYLKKKKRSRLAWLWFFAHASCGGKEIHSVATRSRQILIEVFLALSREICLFWDGGKQDESRILGY